MSDPKNPQAGLTQEQLLEIIKAIKAPPEPTERQKAEEKQAAESRRQRGQIELNKIAEQKLIQSICDHTRENGSTRTVHVYGTDNLTDYMICQECRAFIHAEPRPAEGHPLAKDFENHIFDTRLFNRHYKLGQRATTF